MNRFLHDDLRPRNASFSLGQLEVIKEQAALCFETSKKLNEGKKVIHENQLTPPEIVAFPKLGTEFTKPILLFLGKSRTRPITRALNPMIQTAHQWYHCIGQQDFWST